MNEAGSAGCGRARGALCAFAAIGLLWTAGPLAAQFDPDSPAVQEAYSGDATPAKVAAARAGLLQVLSGVATSSSFSGGFASVTFSSSSPPLILAPALVIASTLEALSDADLGPPGALLLDSTRLRALASFASARDITVGAGGAIIDTGAFTLTLSGDLAANGALIKSGTGVLELTGSNLWNELPFVAEGRLRGDSVSIATSIRTASFAPMNPIAEIEFAQVIDGTYSGAISGAGVLLKSGGGTLSVDAAQSNSGGTVLSGGTLRMLGAGTIGEGAVSLTAGTLLDLSGSNDAFVAVRGLSGEGAIDLGANRLAIFNASSTFGGRISGDGGVTLRDTALTLTGASTYLGATLLDDAALILSGAGALGERTIVQQASGSSFSIAGADGDRSVGALSGSGGSVALGNNTLTIGAGDTDSSFHGSIDGTGGLVKIGAGRQRLSGIASYTGATRIDTGILSVHPLSISNTVINNAQLEFNVDAPPSFALQTHAYSGTISGTGQLSKTGDGVLWLRGSNSYTGGTEVDEGVLLGNVDSLPGAIVVNKGAVGFFQIDDRTHAGQISGAGLLVKFGPGELALSGSNTHAGGTAFSGPLRIGSDAALGAAGTPVVLAGGDLRIGNDLTLARPVLFVGNANTLHTGPFDLHLAVAAGGVGGVIKRGAGTLHLNGAQTHAGATVIAEGGLKFSGSMHGSLTLGAASTLHVSVDARGQADRIDVTGAHSSVTLDGGRLAVSASDGDYAARTSYTILTAPSINGAFADVTTDLAFLTPAVGIDTDRVVLVLTRNQVQIADFATTSDQRGAGDAVGALLQRGDDAAAIANAFNTLSVREVGSALEQVSGSTLTALGRIGGVHDRMLGRVTGARLAQLTRGGAAAGSGAAGQANLLLAMAGSDGGIVPVLHAMASAASRSPEVTDHRHGVWLRGLAAGGRVDVSANAADAASLRSAGLVAGYDHAVTPSLILGAFAAHMSATVENGVPQSEDERSSWIAGVYARYQPGALYMDAQASLGFDAFETSRRISIGPLQRTAHADYDGDTRSVRLEVGRGIGSEYRVEPYAGLAWIGQQQDAFSETGAGALNLSVARQQFDSVRSTLGVRTRVTSGGNGSSTEFALYAAWAHEWASQGTLSARLAGDPLGGPFQVRGAAAPRNSAQLGLGLAHRLRDDLSLFVDVDGEFSGEQQTVGFSAGLNLRW